MQKEVSYTSYNTYDTLNDLTENTKTVWFVCHGIGYLSKYFIKLFESLNAEENYIIAPQAPSKYYKGDSYKRVGACWLTKENTSLDTLSILNYIDSIFTAESLPKHIRLVILGYSQGVSVASRWIANRKIIPNDLVLISGGFPKELQKEDFLFLEEITNITHIVGENDPLFSKEAVENEKNRLQEIFPKIRYKTHPGGHELTIDSIRNI